MSLNNFAKIVTNGLVFSYDSSSIQSYKGPPLTNLIASKSALTASGTGYSFVGRTELTKVPYFGAINCSVVDIQNNYSAVSTWCCPNPMSYGSATVSPSTTYTYLIMYKCDSGYTNSNYMYRYEYTASGGSYVTEQGVHNDANRVNMGDGWYYAWGTFTTSATTNYLTGLASFYYRYSTLYDTFKVAKVALVQGNYAGLHPKYWPEHSQTRTNTQTLVDVFGNNTITATNLAYNSDGSFSFNGSNTYALVTDASILSNTNNLTIDLWFKSADVQTRANDLIGKGSSDADEEYCIIVNNYIYFDVGTGSGPYTQPSYTFLNNTWYNIVCTHERVSGSSTLKTYINGVLLSGSTITPTNAANDNSLPLSLGRRFYNSDPNSRTLNGSLPSVKIYNRTLSEAEVTQNFNALRGRYGI